MLYEQLKVNLIDLIKAIYSLDIQELKLEHPENQLHGDYSTNVAFVLAKIVKQDPMTIAKNIVYEINRTGFLNILSAENIPLLSKAEALSPGYINLFYSNNWLTKLLKTHGAHGTNYRYRPIYKSKKIMVEYTDPNPFKVFHIGHLMTNAIGESISRIYAYLGADVKRANYQGDVGMHVAKSIWGISTLLKASEQTIYDIENLALEEKIAFMGRGYALGNNKYENDIDAANEMKAINAYIFKTAQEMNKIERGLTPVLNYNSIVGLANFSFDPSIIKEIYLRGRKWSLDYFETLYTRLGTKFDYYYFESMVAEKGYDFVHGNIDNGVFEVDNSAVIYRGERDGLHTRVFINSLGLPVYEAKDLGLAFIKYNDFNYDTSIIITANEINTYFKVVLSAMRRINPDLAEKTVHLGHGLMKLKEGKMSSRTGNIIGGDSLLNDLKETVVKKMNESNTTGVSAHEIDQTADKIAVASLKYSILKNGIGNDIVYDKDEVLNLSGNTGAYILYTYSRTQSLLSSGEFNTSDKEISPNDLLPLEIALIRHIAKLDDVVFYAAQKIAPNLIATFVFDLAQLFNRYYAETSIIKAETQNLKDIRLCLTNKIGETLKVCMNLLGIEVVAKM